MESENDLYKELCRALQLPESFHSIISNVYLPLAKKITNQTTVGGPLFISINGAQGSGKSTLTQFLKLILQQVFNHNVVAFSLDDFYLTRAQRKDLAASVHPLLVTRGVPGTHDLVLMQSVMRDLLAQRACRIPVFDKAIDDRVGTEQWQEQNSAVDIILFEGWCNDSPPQNNSELVEPINQLESSEDSDGTWRRYVNQQLGEYRQSIFKDCHFRIFLKVPGFDQVFQWRLLQEEKLRAQSNHGKALRIMTESELRRFIQHYERITRHTLANYAKQADIVLSIDARHSIRNIVEH